MANRDVILEAIRSSPGGLTDAQVVERTGVRPHQQVNQICRRLADSGEIVRDRSSGRIVNRIPAVRRLEVGSGIEVTETVDRYLVKIHPNDRVRAKRIAGRSWDWGLQRWIYTKSAGTYEALAAEFRGDADVFEINPPRSPEDQSASAGQPDDADSWWSESPGPSSNPGKLGEFIEEMVAVTEGIRRLEGTVDEVRKLVGTDSEKKAEDGSDGSGPPVELFEKGLRVIAGLAAKEDPAFQEWLEEVSPISDRYEFVMRSHEMLKRALVEFGGGSDRSASFGELVSRLRDRELLPRRPLNVPQTLFAMNDHRNWMAHTTNADYAEQLARSAIYLLNLALVWPLVSTPVAAGLGGEITGAQRRIGVTNGLPAFFHPHAHRGNANATSSAGSRPPPPATAMYCRPSCQ